MTMTQQVRQADPAAVDEFTGRLLGEFAVAAALPTTLLGIRLGLWQALAGAGPLAAQDVAEACGLPRPFVRDWLLTQAAGGYLDYDPHTERFTLPAAVGAVLADAGQVAFARGLATQISTWYTDLPRLQQALASGHGLGWQDRSRANSDGMDEISRAVVAPALTTQWLPALEIGARLHAGASVADVGCGYGAAVLAIAASYPAARVSGFDSDDASIARARHAASEAVLADRVRFEVAHAKDFPGSGYDLVTFIDVFHDLGDPVGALAHAREALAPGGVVLLVEPAAADRVEDNFTPLGRLFYASSSLVCTPNALDQEGHALGALAGRARLREVAGLAGFERVRQLPVPAPFNILLECRP